MEIVIPQQFGYSELKSLTVQYYETSLADVTAECTFDWRQAARVSLPQVVAVLNWSSKLAYLKKRVQWTFAEPSIPTEGIERLEFWSDVALGEERFKIILQQFDKLMRQARHGRLYPSSLLHGLDQIRSAASVNDPALQSAVERWLLSEEARLKYMNFLAYLKRYEVFDRASETGIVLTPDPRRLPKTFMGRSAKTGCLELRPIQSVVEVGGVISQLCDPLELNRVLGAYADIDVVRRGALAQILVTELGQNVGEHAHASAAWLCTRVISNEQVHRVEDPVYLPFRKHEEGLLEIIVCDNGRGLTAKLAQVLAQDKRASVISKYKRNPEGHYETADLIDYAFDRLSSSKRDIVQLVHLEEQPANRRVVASGLYWVWNVVRSHRGVLAVQTANIYSWYDFTRATEQDNLQWLERQLERDESAGPACGTMIRICLPLKNKIHVPRLHTAPTYSSSDQFFTSARPSVPSTIKIVWVGDLARKVPLTSTRGNNAAASRGAQTILPGINSTHEAKVLRELQRNHFPLKDGDILALDLCGMRTKWATQSVAPLCHFFLEMNYTSTVARSAVVLWNVPSSAKEVFEKGIEIAGQPYSHLEDFRRGALIIYDDGTIRIFCGWEKAERVLSLLRYEGEIDLREVRDPDLDEADLARLRLFITENPHLFEWLSQDRLRLRPWPLELRGAAWKQGMEWFKSLLGRDLPKGVLLSPKKGYIRLPSNGMYVKQFFQFRGLLSNHQDCARIAWHIAQVIGSLHRRYEHGSRPHTLWLISGSRSTVPLLQHLSDNYFNEGMGVKFLVGSRVEELEAKARNLPDGEQAILITDVISSGTLCEQVARALPSMRWLGTVSFLDTRSETVDDHSSSNPIELEPGITLFKTKEAATGPVYTLECRGVKKVYPTDVPVTDPVIAIDEVNVCAVVTPEQPDAQADFWSYLERKPDALHIGHLLGSYHHYNYYVDTGELLNAVHPADGKSLLSFIVDGVMRDITETGCDPDKVVIMHPPRDASHAERIGKAVQEASGALYRHVLYKDNFAGHWRFSPFVQHGVPLTGSTLVLIDDGTNTAETLMGLLDAATLGHPLNVLAYVGVTRMPPHKNHLFLTIKSLERVSGNVHIRFTLALSIPVYSSKDCPVCKFRHHLSRVEEYSPLLRKYASQLRLGSAPSGLSIADNEIERTFPWTYSEPISVAKFREAFETLDYNVSSSEYVNSVLRAASFYTGQDSHDALLNLGFIVCSEPEIAGSTVLVPYLRLLLESAFTQLEGCPEDEVMTFVILTFHLMLWSEKRGKDEDLNEAVRKLWQALFSREEVSIQLLCKIVAFVLAESLADGDADHEQQRPTQCQMWLQALREKIKEETERDQTSLKPLVNLHIREALAVLKGLRPYCTPAINSRSSLDLYELADSTASMFWWHASDNVKGYIDTLIEVLGRKERSSRDAMYGPIHQLVYAFDSLYDLQQRLCEVEQVSQHSWHEKSGAEVYWNAPELTAAMAACVQAFTNVAGLTEHPREGLIDAEVIAASRALRRSWNELYRLLVSAFDAIFPQVFDVVGERWDNFQTITGLPHSADKAFANDPPPPPRHARVFIPRTLLSRFMNVAMLNLQTAAFDGWTQDQKRSEASAFVEMSSMSNDDGDPTISVRVVDNGKMHSSGKVESTGHSKGLDDVALMAENFRARLTKPYLRDGYTVVELRMMYRATRSTEHVGQ